ncbi:GMC oxidoreductase-like protein [Thermothelomyces thermophilus ATCC 42464]|uniref:GMC oxidoreductase-like protein n=1 Tax=Thermothelomyces thermophilus (strain ATCC 42464 / BCRC 31852 / DSM 1799) TaxID=573729 RepID=G2QNN9_THET4|nr:GMC oxidoreductase-like protein [Thermothelomyces thermophilus ATCC 42464]AEO61263.1 GMC oxidoreductase-like protein [Thermothelomyces thermophilus ATCC 42464]
MMFRWLLIGLGVLAHKGCAGSESDDKYYDYIVVGSGPGGGPLASNLARAGYSVLLLEAGSDQSNNTNSEIVSLFGVAYTDPTLRWDFFAFNFANETRNLQHNHLTWRRPDGSFYVGRDPPPNSTLLGIYYPRGGTLGGSSAVNAMSTIYPSESDWQNIVDLTGDTTWSPEHMREIFERIEKNHYLTPGAPGHGFNGYLDTIMSTETSWAGQNDLLAVLGAISGHLGQSPSDIATNVLADPNGPIPERDQTEGIFGSPLHADAAWRRFSSRDYILETARAVGPDGQKQYQLTVQLETLATKVLFADVDDPQKKPRANGVEFLQGQSVYSADPRHTASNQGTTGRAYARKEVILSGGTFNSPQLLKLSGIGPASELAQFDIDVVVDLPGVGANLQDNYEVPVVGHAARDFQQPAPDPDAPTCTYGAPGDPCVELWKQGRGPYTVGPPLDSIFRKSAHAAYDERDFFLVGGTFALRGFWPPTDSVPADPPNTFGLSTVKINPQSRSGTVLLRSADPRDTPEINFHLFEEDNAGTELDLNAELDTVKWARRAFADVPAPLGPIIPVEPPCPGTPAADGTCDDEADREWIKNQIFGHHPTSTCAIGADSDPLAVLDSKFRVRGVRGLRVVDASAFPRVPGPFPVLPIFMLSEKATESVLEDAEEW